MHKSSGILIEFISVLITSVILGIGGALILAFVAFHNGSAEYQYEPILYSIAAGALSGAILFTLIYYRYLGRTIQKSDFIYVIVGPLLAGVALALLFRIFDAGWIVCFIVPLFVCYGAIKTRKKNGG